MLTRTVLVIALLASPGTVLAGDLATLSFSKVFPRSDPEYISITVKETGEATIDQRRLDEPAHPDPVTLSRETTDRLFALAAQLDYFRGHPQWEPRQRIAAMGQKTFVYQKGGERNDVTFNYSLLPDVQRLTELFEGVSRTWYYRERIARALVYDRLALLDIMRSLEYEFNRGHLAEPVLLLPLLRQIVSDSRILHLAQMKAQRLLERIGDPRARLSFSRITYSNPGMYLSLSVAETGEATYEIRAIDAAPTPRPLTLAPALVARLFALAETLDHFRTEPKPDVDNAREAPERTTLAYEGAAERHELTLTATTHPQVREMIRLAERILRQQWHREKLEQSRTDPAAVGPALTLLEDEIRQGLLIDPAQLTPLLNEMARDRRIRPSVQQQASQLATRLAGPKE